jgi:hypothetical protein
MDRNGRRTWRGWIAVTLGLGLTWPLFLLAGCHPNRPVASPPEPEANPSIAEPLPDSDPVTFLEKCLARYDRRHIRGYHAYLHKQERINGKLDPPGEIEVWYRTQPHSVFLHWLQGAHGAESVLYVEGENGGKLLVHPSGLAGRLVKDVAIDPDSPEARQSGRYSIRDFGLRETLARTVHQWSAASEQGELQVEYLGVKKVPEVGDRYCYTLRRTFQHPQSNGIVQAAVFLDQETWFQVGTVLRSEGGSLIGEYLYRDIQLNPNFKANQFEPSAP